MKEPVFDIQQRTFDFALIVVRKCYQIMDNNKEFILTKQLIRSSTSVGANMREAHNTQSNKDFVYKLSICQKECAESIYWIDLLFELDGKNDSDLLKLKDEAEQLLKIIKTISINVKQKYNL
jgi:four helix bundle protein